MQSMYATYYVSVPRILHGEDTACLIDAVYRSITADCVRRVSVQACPSQFQPFFNCSRFFLQPSQLCPCCLDLAFLCFELCSDVIVAWLAAQDADLPSQHLYLTFRNVCFLLCLLQLGAQHLSLCSMSLLLGR